MSAEPIFLSEDNVLALLDRDRYLTGAVEALEAGFREYDAQRVITGTRERVQLISPRGSTDRLEFEREIRILPAMVPLMDISGVRIGATSRVTTSGSAFTLLLDFVRMAPLAIIADHYLHGVRSGAPTGLAVRLLAKDDARVMGVIGAGRIARVQVAVSLKERKFAEIRVFSPTRTNREQFAREIAEKFGIKAIAVESAEEAASNVDVLLTATTAFRAVVMGSWIRDGCLICSCGPGELDLEVGRRGRIIVTTRNRLTADMTPPQEPWSTLFKNGELDVEECSTLGELLTGTAVGRTRVDEVIVFVSKGIGFCDIVLAKWLYDLALQSGLRSQHLSDLSTDRPSGYES